MGCPELFHTDLTYWCARTPATCISISPVEHVTAKISVDTSYYLLVRLQNCWPRIQSRRSENNRQ